MPTYKLKVDKASVNGTTGHHTILAQVIETTDDNQTVNGVPEVHGIDSIALQRKFNGDINQWLIDVGRDSLAKHLNRSRVHMELLKLNGTMIDLEPKKLDSVHEHTSWAKQGKRRRNKKWREAGRKENS